MLSLLPQDEQQSAFDELVDRYEKKVFNLIYRIIGDYDDAADLTQDTFVAAYRAFNDYRADSSPYTWLYRIAVNVCKNKFRQLDKRRDIETVSLDNDARYIGEEIADGGLTNPLPTPDRALEREEMRQMVELAISSLPEDYRIVIVLRDLHGLAYREIAEATDLSLDVVKTRLARAREMLRRKLGHYLV
jgi:RNA polymerase sigma-70 factor (ECF subfamily)